MAESSAVCSDPILGGKWKSWCRLCAKADAEYINVITGQSQEEFITDNLKCHKDLANAILEFLRIHIKEDDKLPQIICKECDEMMSSLIKFSERANKVQQMYDDLRNSINKSTINLQMLLENYGLHSTYKDETVLSESGTELPVEEVFVNDFVEVTTSITESQVEDGQQDETISKHESESESDDPFEDDKRDIDNESTAASSVSGDGRCSTDSEDSCMDISLSKLKDRTKRKSNVKKKSKSPKNVDDDTTKKYSCSICVENFKRSSNYTLHMKRKHGVFNCRHCTETFKTELDLKQHMQEPHKKSWKCLHCEQTFERKALRTIHMKTEHSSIQKAQNKTKTTTKTANTTTTKTHKTQQKTTTTTNSRSFDCVVCGEAFPQKKQRKEHMLAQHPDYQPNVCNVCGRVFRFKSNLTKHLERHGDKYVCTECGKLLTCRAALNTHMLVHSDEAPHKCDVCGRAFKRHKALKYHLIAHTGLRPYPCDFCEKSFSTGSSCRLHKKTMHPNELAALEATGAVQYTKNVPKLADLRVVARTGTNFRPLMSKQNGYAPRC